MNAVADATLIMGKTLSATSSGTNDQGHCGFLTQRVMVEDEVLDAPLYCGQFDEEYSFSNPMRAKVVIFNHYLFDEPPLLPRKGTNRDVEALLETLPRLGFSFEDGDIDLHEDFTSLEIQITMNNLSKKDFSKYDCLMMFVLTHGFNTETLWARDKRYNKQFLWENFVANKCPTLAGKPKLFIIEASRGDQFCKTVTLMNYEGKVKDQVGVNSSIKPNCSPSRSNIIPFESKKASYNMPVLADFLQVYSTAEGQVCFREVERGSWFIQTLCKNLLLYSPHLDILKIITRTALQVAVGSEFETTVYSHGEDVTDRRGNVERREVYRVTRQVPSFYSTLTRDLYFRPGRP